MDSSSEQARKVVPPLRESFAYDPDFHGPVQKRICTDVPCLTIFLAFNCLWISIGCYALVIGDFGNIAKSSESVDFAGQICGEHSKVMDKPYLFYIDQPDCALKNRYGENHCYPRKICVSKCPSKFFMYQYGSELEEVKIDLYCVYDLLDNMTTSEDLDEAIQSGLCASWYVESEPEFGNCMPILESLKGIDESDLKNNVTKAEVKHGATEIKNAMKSAKVMEIIAENLRRDWVIMLLFVVMAAVLAMLYVLLLRYFAAATVFITLIGMLVILIWEFVEAVEDHLDALAEDVDVHIYSTGFDVFINGIILIYTLMVLFCMGCNIFLAIALLEETRAIIGQNMITLAFPLFPCALKLMIFVWNAAVILYFVSTGKMKYTVIELTGLEGCEDYHKGDLCLPAEFDLRCGRCGDPRFELEPYFAILMLVQIAGFFWNMWFVSDVSQMVLAGVSAAWYWAADKTTVGPSALLISFWRTVRYHLGTIAFGSVLTVESILVSECVEMITKRGWQKLKLLSCCCGCCLYFLEFLLRITTKNIYILCAVHGKNFCNSARDFVWLVKRNLSRVIMVEWIYIHVLREVRLMIAVFILSALILVRGEYMEENYIYKSICYVLVLPALLWIPNVVFDVYLTAARTSLLCCMEDLERNDGTNERPYLMSDRLRRLLVVEQHAQQAGAP